MVSIPSALPVEDFQERFPRQKVKTNLICITIYGFDSSYLCGPLVIRSPRADGRTRDSWPCLEATGTEYEVPKAGAVRHGASRLCLIFDSGKRRLRIRETWADTSRPCSDALKLSSLALPQCGGEYLGSGMYSPR